MQRFLLQHRAVSGSVARGSPARAARQGNKASSSWQLVTNLYPEFDFDVLNVAVLSVPGVFLCSCGSELTLRSSGSLLLFGGLT